MVHMKYCTKCMNTGVDIDNNPCECRVNAKSFYESVSCLDIPAQYRGVHFNEALVPKDLSESYTNFLQNISNEVSAGRIPKKNMFICSPISHSKSVLAYSCIELLFRSGIPTFPLYDVLELKRMLMDFDLGRKQTYDIDKPELIVSVPLLFVKVPRVTSWEVFDAIAMLLDRRVRRNNTTIFIYDGNWGQLVYNDKQNILTGLMGDGHFNSFEVKSWSLPDGPTGLPEVQIKDNLG